MRGDQRYYSTQLQRYLRNELPASEVPQLFNWINEEPAAFEKIIGDADIRMHLVEQSATINVREETSVRIKERLMESIGRLGDGNSQQVYRGDFGKTPRVRWVKYAAAIVILLTGISVYYIFSGHSGSEKSLVQNVPTASGNNDVMPGYNRAVLTLSDGKKIQLDSAASETINDGTLSIENNNGQLIYSGLGSNVSEKPPIPSNGGVDGRMPGRGGLAAVGYNAMSTPNGGQYKLTLSDGTKVWLNAASSISYPTIFTEKTREVSITGEVYFEVKKDPAKPFVVKTLEQNITVLGTEFNVNAYSDEKTIKTSLINGSVKVGEKILIPGQAYVNGKIISTNLQQDIAWKNGVFDFKGLNVEQAMRQISRWYNLEIIYKNKIPDIRFFGRINRNVSLSTVLLALEKAGVKFIVEGNKLIVQ